MGRLNAFATPEHRHHTAVIIYKSKAIAIMGFIGPADSPLYLGGSGGAMSTADVEAFLCMVSNCNLTFRSSGPLRMGCGKLLLTAAAAA